MKASMYISRAAQQGSAPWMPHDYVNLISASRKNNAGRAITGFLCYQDGYFLQYLEGPERATEALLVKILNDSRHSDIQIMLNENISQRSFSKWSMPIGNKIAKDEEFRRFTRLNQYLFSRQSEDHRKLLNSFHVYVNTPTQDHLDRAISEGAVIDSLGKTDLQAASLS